MASMLASRLGPAGNQHWWATAFLALRRPGKSLTRRSLDFWRCENGLVRENWVLVDLLHIYDQLGVDVFGRMRELTVARQRRPIKV